MENKNKYDSIIDQIWVLCCILSAFLLAASFNYAVLGKTVPVWALMILVVLVPFDLFCGAKRVLLWIKTFDKEYLFEVMLFLMVFVLRVPMFQYLQRYDGAIYWGPIYECAKDFQFSLGYIWNGFKLWGHTSVMFTFFSIIGEFFTLGNTIGYCVINTIMSSYAIVCIYKIFIKKFNIDRFMALLLSITLQCTPLFWGTFSHVNPDYMILIFFIYMWYSHIFDKYILCFFWMFCLLQTKETGSVIVLGYALSFMVYIFWFKQNGKNIFKLLKNPFVVICILNAVTFLILLLIQGSMITWQLPDLEQHKWFVGNDEIISKGTDVHAFGIYPRYIACKVLHIFSLNFSWVASLIIILYIVLAINKRKAFDKDLDVCIPLAGAIAIFALFSSVYITYAIYRYNVFSEVMLWFIALLFISKMIKRRNAAIPCIIAILLMLAGQTYYNLDFVTNAIFDKYPTGKNYILATDMKKIMYGDNTINNYMYTYIDELIDTMLKEVDYNDTMVMVYSDDDRKNRTEMYALSSQETPLEAGWDRNRARRVIMNDLNIDACLIRNMSFSEMISGEGNRDDKFLVYYFDYATLNDDKELSKINDDFRVEYENTIENWGGYLHYMLLERQ